MTHQHKYLQDASGKLLVFSQVYDDERCPYCRTGTIGVMSVAQGETSEVVGCLNCDYTTARYRRAPARKMNAGALPPEEG